MPINSTYVDTEQQYGADDDSLRVRIRLQVDDDLNAADSVSRDILDAVRQYLDELVTP
jgi:hypothetical protein